MKGCSYDHVELNFYVNGKPLNLPVRGVKGNLFPAFYGNFFIYYLYQRCLIV